MAERIFPATDNVLNDVLSFVESELENNDCPMKLLMQISVCVEEMFVNVAHYAYGDDEGDVTVAVQGAPDGVSITFIDSGKPFDPLAKADPDITLSAEERQIGGLGIFIVKKSMDDVGYERKNNKNIFTMKKKF